MGVLSIGLLDSSYTGQLAISALFGRHQTHAVFPTLVFRSLSGCGMVCGSIEEGFPQQIKFSRSGHLRLSIDGHAAMGQIYRQLAEADNGGWRRLVLGSAWYCTHSGHKRLFLCVSSLTFGRFPCKLKSISG